MKVMSAVLNRDPKRPWLLLALGPDQDVSLSIMNRL